MNKNQQILFDEENKFISGKGFKKKFEIEKEQEETFYNSNFDPFKVIKIDKCAIDVTYSKKFFFFFFSINLGL